MEAGRGHGELHDHIDLSWHELQALSTREAQFNFGVPQLLVSELSIIATQIEAAKTSADPQTLERALRNTRALVKRLKSLSRAAYGAC